VIEAMIHADGNKTNPQTAMRATCGLESNDFSILCYLISNVALDYLQPHHL